MVALILAGILLTIYSRERRFSWPLLRPALAWSISFGGLGLVLGLALVGPQNIPQTILPHLLAPAQAGFRGANFAINTHLQLAVLLLVVLVNSAIPTLQGELVDSFQTDSFALRGTAGKLKVLNLMADYADRTHWILTDMPMYAFLVRRPVPPLLATFSEKRLLTDSITAEEVLATLRAYNPEQVMLARFNLPLLDEYLALNYSLVASPEFFRLYIRKDLLILAQ